jgi:hypothetical protein
MAEVADLVVVPLVAPIPFLFDAVDSLSEKYLTDRWIGSIPFCCLPIFRSMIGAPLDKTCIQEVDICHYLGRSSSHPFVARLYLDPGQDDEPPFSGDPSTSNPHWIQLKEALEAAFHSSGSPLMCNGGGHDSYALETDRTTHVKTSPIPFFSRIRTVKKWADFLVCDCGTQQRAHNASDGKLFP